VELEPPQSHIIVTQQPADPVATLQEILANDDLIPRDRYPVISSVHNTVRGHHGVERTVQKLHALGHTTLSWPKNMWTHVRTFIRKCPCCQKMSALQPIIHTHPFVVNTFRPMERLMNVVDTYVR